MTSDRTAFRPSLRLHRRAVAMVLGTALLSMHALSHAQAPAAVQVQVQNAWARASVQGQKGTGAFMTLTAPRATRLVGASSPAAGVAEVHEMKMEGDIMRMRPIAGLDLPAGKPVELKPGGYHVMLMDLKAPLAKDTNVPLTLVFKDAAGKESHQEVMVPVRVSAPAAMTAPGGAMPMPDMPMHKH